METPSAVLSLVQRGVWPNEMPTRASVDAATVQEIAPEDTQLWLMPPPFQSVASDNRAWFGLFQSPGVDYERAWIIADFGSGSDAVIVLDDRVEPAAVWALVFADGEGRWTLVAESIEDFARWLGIK